MLEFVEIQSQDSGVYTCEAENIFGTDEKKFRVTVYRKFRIFFDVDDYAVSFRKTTDYLESL